MRSACVRRSDGTLERHVARIAVDRAADAAPEPVRPAAAELAPMLVAARSASLLNARHTVPAPEAPLDRRNGGPWIL